MFYELEGEPVSPSRIPQPSWIVPRRSSPRLSGVAQRWLCPTVLDKDRSAEESMTLINSVRNVLPEELPVSGSPNMSVLFRDALSGITIKLQCRVIAANGCKSHWTLLAAQVRECERRGAFPKYWIWVRSLYSKKGFSVGFFFFFNVYIYIFLLKGFLLSRAESTE